MACEAIRMVLEINGKIVTERMVRKSFQGVEQQKSEWRSMYDLSKKEAPFNMYIQIESKMEAQKNFKKYKKYIKHYESEK